MRNCPVCSNAGIKLCAYQQIFDLYECPICGMRYLDSSNETISQKFFDDYYVSDTSVDLNGADSTVRLQALADYIGPLTVRSVDIGGKWSKLQEMLPGLETLNAGETLQGEYGLFILSHTLEHVYDVTGLMTEIKVHAAPGARVIVEGPVWFGYGLSHGAYDYFWQHINKFLVNHLTMLLFRHGFTHANLDQLPEFQGFHCVRVEGVCMPSGD